jgi:hypothetical protein
MNRLKQLKRFLFLMLIGLFILSCNENEKLDLHEKIIGNENFVTVGDARDICTSIEYPTTANTSKEEKTSKKIKSIDEISDELGDIVYYIINYEQGGFVILSADNRLYPFLAFSETNTFPVNADNYNAGLENWLDKTKRLVQEVRKSNSLQKQEIKKIWNELDGIRPPDPDPDPDPEDDCENIYTIKGPFLTTKWNQDGNYNDSIPFGGCDFGEEAFVGCVAVAGAQVMRFHEYPNNYNWSNMLDATATSETCLLLKDVGVAVDMDWGCTGSSALTADLATALVNSFGYNSANYSSFNRYTVTYELDRGRPVILRGVDLNYSSGHAWVCDGYLRSYFCVSGASYLSLHMNWGWGGDQDGYYYYDNWDPNGLDLNYSPYMITNIIP